MGKGTFAAGLLLGLSAIASAKSFDEFAAKQGFASSTQNPPRTTLLPATLDGHDFYDYKNLIPKNDALLLYAKQGGRLAARNKHSLPQFAELNATFTSPTVLTERSDHILDIECSDNGLDIYLANDRAFAIAKKQWKFKGLYFLTHGEGCAEHSDKARTYWKTSAVSFSAHDKADGGIAHITCEEVDLRDALTEVDLKWGARDNFEATKQDRMTRRGEAAKRAISRGKPTCKPPLPGFGDIESANWCKPNFDNRLDKKIGLTTIDEDSFVPALQDAAAGIENADNGRQNLTKRWDPFSGDIGLDLTPNMDTDSYYGPATLVGSNDEGGVYCVECGTQGGLSYAGGLIYSFPFDIKSLFVDVNGQITNTLKFAVENNAPISAHFEREFFSFPLGGFWIPLIIDIGPQVNLGVAVDVNANTPGKTLPTGIQQLGPFKGRIDFISGEGGLDGLDLNLANDFLALGEVSVSQRVSFPVGLFFGVTVFPIIHPIKLGGQLTFAPGYESSAQFDPNSQECKGISWGNSHVDDISLDIYALKRVASWKLLEWRSNEYRGCIGLDAICGALPVDLPVGEIPDYCKELDPCKLLPNGVPKFPDLCCKEEGDGSSLPKVCCLPRDDGILLPAACDPCKLKPDGTPTLPGLCCKDKGDGSPLPDVCLPCKIVDGSILNPSKCCQPPSPGSPLPDVCEPCKPKADGTATRPDLCCKPGSDGSLPSICLPCTPKADGTPSNPQECCKATGGSSLPDICNPCKPKSDGTPTNSETCCKPTTDGSPLPDICTPCKPKADGSPINSEACCKPTGDGLPLPDICNPCKPKVDGTPTLPDLCCATRVDGSPLPDICLPCKPKADGTPTNPDVCCKATGGTTLPDICTPCKIKPDGTPINPEVCCAPRSDGTSLPDICKQCNPRSDGTLPPQCCLAKPGQYPPKGCPTHCVPILGVPLPSDCSRIVTLGDGKKYSISTGPDGNFQLSHGAGSATEFREDNGILLSNNDRFFHFYSDTMEEYGVSRMRLSELDQMPMTAQMFALAPVDLDDDGETDQYVPIDIDGNVYNTVVCSFKDQEPKLFLEKKPNGYKPLYRKDLIWSVTGGQVQYCQEMRLRFQEVAQKA